LLVSLLAPTIAHINKYDANIWNGTLQYQEPPAGHPSIVNGTEAISYFITSYNGGQGAYYINGYEPSSGSKLPLFMWVTGTFMNPWLEDSWTITTYMANQGFVSASIVYDNLNYPVLCSSFEYRAKSIFDVAYPTSAISVLCARPNVDCSKGVLIMGFSQGSNIGSLAASYSPYIRGFYEVSGGYDATLYGIYLPCMEYTNLKINHKLMRSVSGQNDEVFGVDLAGVRNEQETITGYTCNGEQTCIQTGGSGWYIVKPSQPKKGYADHCYAWAPPCGPALDGNYYPGTAEWGLEYNLNWLIQQSGINITNEH